MDCCQGADHLVVGQVLRQELRLELPRLVALSRQLALLLQAALELQMFALQVPKEPLLQHQYRPQRAQLLS